MTFTAREQQLATRSRESDHARISQSLQCRRRRRFSISAPALLAPFFVGECEDSGVDRSAWKLNDADPDRDRAVIPPTKLQEEEEKEAQGP